MSSDFGHGFRAALVGFGASRLASRVVAGVRVDTWRLMGSYKWGYRSPNRSYNYGCPLRGSERLIWGLGSRGAAHGV